jgi:hypothetical protein
MAHFRGGELMSEVRGLSPHEAPHLKPCFRLLASIERDFEFYDQQTYITKKRPGIVFDLRVCRFDSLMAVLLCRLILLQCNHAS